MSSEDHMNMATGALDRSHYRRHTAWLKAKRIGVGRLEIAGEILRGLKAVALDLSHAKLEQCDLYKSDFNNTHLISAELTGCDFAYSNFHMAWLAKAQLRDCQLEGTIHTLVRMDGITSTQCDFTLADMRRVSLVDARFENCQFRDAQLDDAKFTRSVISNCSFEGSHIVKVSQLSKLGRIDDCVFNGCDFRGADFEGVRIWNSKFYDCNFAGAHGTPEIEGNVDLLWSANFGGRSAGHILDGVDSTKAWESGELYKS